jgi:Uma2 family endonuclease
MAAGVEFALSHIEPAIGKPGRGLAAFWQIRLSRSPDQDIFDFGRGASPNSESPMATTESQSLLTAEQYAVLPDSGRPTELVRGKVIEMNMPFPRHGQVCGRAFGILYAFAEQHDLGHVLSNDSGVVTERNPDSVRGADVAFYTYARTPRGPLPNRYLEVQPDVVIEVRSPSDRWVKLMGKVAEYLDSGVSVVCVFDPEAHTIHVNRADQPPQKLEVDDELHLPEIAESFRVPVRQFFE